MMWLSHFPTIMNWIFSDVGLLWPIIEVLLTSLVICLMVRNVETWSDKFREKQRVPMPLVLLITVISMGLCCVIDFLWNLWSIYDIEGGTLDMLSSFAKDLYSDKFYVYLVMISAIMFLVGIYFSCLKPYRLTGIILLCLSVVVLFCTAYFANQTMMLILKKRLLPMRRRIVYGKGIG